MLLLRLLGVACVRAIRRLFVILLGFLAVGWQPLIIARPGDGSQDRLRRHYLLMK